MQNPHNEYIENMTGVLLAGGASRRMGKDKALLEVAGRPLYQYSLDLLCRYCATVLIAGDRTDLTRDDIPAVPDLYPGSALGGLYTGLSAAQTDWIFVTPCDMPYPDARILERLVEQRHGFDAVVPRTPAGYEPVFALYKKTCLPAMESMLRNQQYRIYDFYQKIKVHFLEWHRLPSDWERSLINLNTPEQLQRATE